MSTQGNELYRLLIQLTGIEEEQVKGELDRVLARLGFSPATLTMQEVRQAMVAYLEECSAQVEEEAEALVEIDPLDFETIEA